MTFKISSYHRAGVFRLTVILLSCVALLSTGACSSSSSRRSGTGRDGGLLEGNLDASRESRFGGDSSIPSAEGEGPFRDVFFPYDSSTISGPARNDIEANAQLLRDFPEVKVTLEGHTDERGTEEYNLQLGQARARSVRDYLVSLGISPSRIQTISYGENIPLEEGSGESVWARNRRVHFSGHRGTR